MVHESSSVPSGTLTFFFSDVVGSTRLWAADADAMSAALRVHDRILRESIESRGGHVFATAGDSYAAAFSRASSATECAAAVQHAFADTDWGAGPALRVRIGLHLGEAEERDGNYFGPTLNLAARVMAAAHGGQCVMTEGVQAAAGVAAADLGIHQLRDIDTPVHLYQLGNEVFPPLWSVGVGIVSLPSPRTSLIGRDESVVNVRRLVGEHRLVTLTGVGGCGKTRLAIEVAHREVPAHPEGVWFVDLSTIADDTALEGAFSTALGVAVDGQSPTVEQVATYLAPRDALLVVDNCEHVVEEVGEFLDRLLERCPRLRILATSRESLEIDGEFTWKVPSLGTGVASPAVQLFIDRATAAGATIADDEATTAIIVDLVERLDGIPLAIELAAARARSMDIAEIRERLDDRFRILSGGKRRSRQRQATLEAAVQWSYDLLTADEQAMLECLSVFQGGFAVNDVAAVAGVDEIEAADLVDALAAKSLVDLTRDNRGHFRHRLLETIRLFALARLVERGDAVAVRDRHLDHFLNDPVGASLDAWLDIESLWRIDREFENFRSAATWALEQARPGATVRFAAVISDAASARGERQLVLEWLRLDAELEPRDRVFASTILAHTLNAQGDPAALEVATLAVEVGRELMCEDLVFALFALATAKSLFANWESWEPARSLLEEGQRIARASFGPNVRAVADMFFLTSFLLFVTDKDIVVLAETSLAEAPRFGFRHITEAWRAFLLLTLGEIDRAQEAVESFSPVPPGSQWGCINLVVEHAVMTHAQGADIAAKSLALASKELIARRPQSIPDLLQGFAYIAYQGGDDDRARYIVTHTQSFGTVALQNWLVVTLEGATQEHAYEVLSARAAEHPIAECHAFNIDHGPRLLTDELDRWS